MVGTVPSINTENLTLVPTAENDFNRIDIVFSVKFQNKVIGEAYLYNSNYRGKIEIACSISEEYKNREFEGEILKALSNWALYTGNFETITAKCHKDDTSLFSVLSSFMHQTAEDNEFYYFETIV